MERKNNTDEPNLLLELLVTPIDARSKLNLRIGQGNQIKAAKISSQQDLNSTRQNYYKWNDYNRELLKRLFSTNELSKEYSYWGGVSFSSTREPTLEEKIADFHKDIRDKIHRLDSIIERIELIPVSTNISQNNKQFKSATEKKDKSKIFIVHGHDDAAKLEVARFIEKLEFEPIILHEQVSQSQTIIEKIEEYSDVGFGVVLYTPCDVGAKSSNSSNLNDRARQNVVFEHGFLIGKLGRSNVCSLVKGKVETLSDISGIVYTPMTSSGWQLELAKELRAAGYSVDMNKVI